MTRSVRADCTRMPLVLGRVATLPIQQALALLEAPDTLAATRRFFAESGIARTALAVASPPLAVAVDEWIASGTTRNAKTPLRALCYALRMTSRCTPFGLFAGVGRVATGAETTLALDQRSPEYRSHTRPDMGALGKRLTEVERGDEREHVIYVTNDAAFVRGDRLHVTNLALRRSVKIDGNDVAEQRDVSLRHTRAVAFVRDFCRAGASYGQIAAALADAFDASAEDSRKLLDRLIEAGIVISTLRPSPAGDPHASLLTSLEAIGEVAAPLRAAYAAAARVDAIPLGEQTPDDFSAVGAAFAESEDEVAATAVQVDLRAAFSGTLGAAILADAEALTEIALRCAGTYELKRYRERFLERYEGSDRMVPLLELVDNTYGLGVPDPGSMRAESDGTRDAALMHAFSEATRDGREEIELTDELLDRLLPKSEGDGGVPRSLEIGFEVAAADDAALASGEYQLIYSTISDHAGKIAGRFLHMLGASTTRDLRAVAAASTSPAAVTAELVYAPPGARAYNLFTRPELYDAQIPVGIGAVAGENAIVPTDLWVGIDNGRFFLWSERRGCRVDVRETHVFTTAMQAPNLCRFLAMIGRDGSLAPRFWFGPADRLTYIPRLRRGRVVIQPRRWSFPRFALGERADAIAERLHDVRERWNMPRFVYLCDMDNRLLLDLDAPITARLIEDQAGDGDVVFREVLPAPNQTWLRGEHGTHAVEFVAQVLTSVPAPTPAAVPRIPQLMRERARFGPGSAWTYVKLYLGAQGTDDFFVTAIAPLLAALRGEGAIDTAFFLRYADPATHLRLRVHAASDAPVRDRLLAAAEDWLRAGRITRYALETYDPEYERYGGPEAMPAVHAFFDHDSRLCAAIMAEGHAGVDARVEAAAASFDAMVAASSDLGALLVRAFAGFTRVKIGARDRESLRRIGAAGRTLDARLLEHALQGADGGERLGAFVHMHCNRLGLDRAAELRVCALLRGLALARTARKPAPTAIREPATVG